MDSMEFSPYQNDGIQGFLYAKLRCQQLFTEFSFIHSRSISGYESSSIHLSDIFFISKPNKGLDYENDYTITWPNGTESQGSKEPPCLIFLSSIQRFGHVIPS